MTTYEKCQQIRKIIMNQSAEVMVYTNWDDTFAAKTIREIPDRCKEHSKEVLDINPCDLTYEQMDDLGFGLWTGNNPIRLIPLWLFPFLAEDFPSEAIDGEKISRKADMDTDCRFGCLAYGVIPATIGTVPEVQYKTQQN